MLDTFNTYLLMLIFLVDVLSCEENLPGLKD